MLFEEPETSLVVIRYKSGNDGLSEPLRVRPLLFVVFSDLRKKASYVIESSVLRSDVKDVQLLGMRTGGTVCFLAYLLVVSHGNFRFGHLLQLVENLAAIGSQQMHLWSQIERLESDIFDIRSKGLRSLSTGLVVAGYLNDSKRWCSLDTDFIRFRDFSWDIVA